MLIYRRWTISFPYFGNVCAVALILKRFIIIILGTLPYSTSGGMYLTETVCGIMKMLMTNQLALQCNWIGSREKLAFCKLNLSPMICG